MYADDADFISTVYTENLITKLLLLPEILKRWNLQMNHGKTEHTRLKRDTVHSDDTKKLRSILSNNKEVAWRISKATEAYRQMNKLWLDKANGTT